MTDRYQLIKSKILHNRYKTCHVILIYLLGSQGTTYKLDECNRNDGIKIKSDNIINDWINIKIVWCKFEVLSIIENSPKMV